LYGPGGQNYLRLQDFHSLDTSKLRQETVAPTACAKFPPVKRLAAALAPVLVAMLATAPTAMAENGVGLAGPTDDKMVTFFCFGVIAFFAAIPIVLSLVQGRLEKRKEQRRSDLERYG
jgi:hypothetical protein